MAMKDGLIKRGANWSFKGFVGGKQLWFPLGPITYYQAKEAKAKIITEHVQNPYKEKLNKKILFSDFCKLWLENYAEGRIRKSTLIRYKQLLELYLKPAFGHRLLPSIRAEHIQKYISSQVKEGKVKPASINRSRTLLHGIFKHALQWKYVSENPVQLVPPLKVPRQEMNFLNKKEIDAFLKAVPQGYHAFFLMAIFTGMRRGELLGAKFKNLNMKTGQYAVRESVFRGKFGEPKTDKAKREIDLPPMVLEALKLQKDEIQKMKQTAGDSWHENDLLFPNRKGKPIDPGHLEIRVFKPSLEKAGIREIRLHDLRHTNVAIRIQAGENPYRISKQIGHSSIKVTMDTYGHLMEKTDPGAAERLQTIVYHQKPPKLPLRRVGKIWRHRQTNLSRLKESRLTKQPISVN